MAKQFPIELYLQAAMNQKSDMQNFGSGVGKITNKLFNLKQASDLKKEKVASEQQKAKAGVIEKLIGAGYNAYTTTPEGTRTPIPSDKLLEMASTGVAIPGITWQKEEKPIAKEIALLYDSSKGTSYLPNDRGGIGEAVDPNTYEKQGYKVSYKPLSSQTKSEYLNARIYGFQKDIVDKFNSDPATKKYQQSKDAANDIIQFATTNTPIGAAAIPTYSARMSGEVGNLSEPDKKPFGGSRAIIDRLNASFAQMATGKLSPDNQKFIIDFANLVSKRSDEKFQALARLRAKQYSKLNKGLYGDEQGLYDMLVPQYPTEQTQNTGTNTPQEDPMGLFK